MPALPFPDFADVCAARHRLGGHIRHTPLLTHPELDEATGGRILVKAESLQRTGSFKLRGAFNALLRFDGTSRARGVIVPSSGNFGQAISLAASELGMPAIVVMPNDAPKVKIANTARWGAEIVLFDRRTTDRAALLEELSAERGCPVLSAFDHPDVIAGQGTLVVELFEDARAMGADVTLIATAIGGGGLASGTVLGAHGISPTIAVHGIQQENWEHARQSLSAGERIRAEPGDSTFCDATTGVQLGDYTFPILRDGLASVVVVDEASVRAAMETAFRLLRIVVEPSAAMPLAAALTGRLDLHGRTAALVLSGGNVDGATFAEAISHGPRAGI